MSYETINQSVSDVALRGRVTAAIADEAWHGSVSGGSFTTMARNSPDMASSTLIWPVCSAADIEAAYASALAGGNPEPGSDESVVTDGMILSAVQAHWPTY